MSLTSHLNTPASPIGQYIKQHFAHTQVLTREPNRQLKSVTTLHPHTQEGGQYPYAVIGTALDYRIRYAFDITPYQQLVAWPGALELTTKAWESNEDIPLNWNTLPSGIPLPVDNYGHAVEAAVGPYPYPLIQTFFDGLNTTLHILQPVGRQLESEAERMLDRYCIVLSYFEQVYRSSAYLQGPLMQPDVKQSVEELLALAEDSWLDDLGMLFNLFYDHYQELLARPRVLNPTFAGSGDVGGADADFVVDGCLIDIKTTTSPQIRADYLYQLAGYALLDYTDKLHLNAVGIYMARQGLLFTWSLHEFVQKLTGDEHATLPALRQEFQALFGKGTRRSYQ